LLDVLVHELRRVGLHSAGAGAVGTIRTRGLKVGGLVLSGYWFVEAEKGRLG
jgi:hypothetical protein